MSLLYWLRARACAAPLCLRKVPSVKTLAMLGILCAAGPAAADAQDTQPLTVQPFTAVYQLEWHGLIAGYSTLTLSQPTPGTYEYSSVNRARGIFRLAFPDAISERSRFRVVRGHVEPLAYQEDNGPGRAKQNVSLTFDWAAGRARGSASEKPVDQPLEPATQDPLSVQVELMRDLIAGEAPTHFLLFDHDAAKQYNYTREGTETLDTAMGRFDTVIYRSDRPDSDRVMRLWLAPALGYLPVQAVRWRKGKIEFELHIHELQRSPAPAESAPPAASGT
jgi:hypothetical protein